MVTPADKHRFAQNDIIGVISQIGNDEFVTVSESITTEVYEGFEYWCALIPNGMLEEVLGNDSFELRMTGGRPGFFGSDPKTASYSRFSESDGMEPLCVRRRFDDLKPDYVELSEEFRHYHNLFEDRRAGKFIKIMNDGTEVEVASIIDNVVRVRTKELRQFLAAKGMLLVVYVYSSRFSEYKLSELEVEAGENVSKQRNQLIYRLQQDYRERKFNSASVIRAKRIIEALPRERCGIWPFGEDTERNEPISFIVASYQGEEIEASCDLRSKIPEGLQGRDIYLRSIYFKSEVLSKYFGQPEKYKVTDGYLRCGTLWGIGIDNNRDDGLISAYLGDLGRHLPYRERIHWRQFNVPPQGGMSATAFARDFECEFAPPTALDHIFDWRMNELQNKWVSFFGWELFKPLSENDTHHSIHIPLNRLDFERQVISLSMITIESINEGKIDSIVAPDKEAKGITKLQKFLQSFGKTDFTVHIKLLRNLRDLRNGCGAHRKGKAYFEAASAFGVDSSPESDAFRNILKSCIRFFEDLEVLVDALKKELPEEPTA